MQFSCTKKELMQGVQAVEKIVSVKTSLPVIGNILFETVGTKVKMSVNNLEVGLEITIPADVSAKGSVLIPAKTFSGVVAKLPEGEVKVNVNDKGSIKVSYGESSFSLRGLSADEFPMLPKVKGGKEFKIKKEEMLKMVKQTIFSVSTNEDKYVLNGVLLEIGKSPMPSDKSDVRFVATDGYRLAWRAAEVGIDQSLSLSQVVPAKALAELSRVLQQTEDEGEVEVVMAEDQISFKHGDVYLVSRLIQGQFPDYKQVIPKKTETKIIVGTELFLEAAERAAVIAAGSANIVKMETKKGKLNILANAPDVGSVNEVVDSNVEGKENIQIAFNVRLVIEALKVIDTERVVIELSGPLNPGVIKPEGSSDYTYIAMPIRTTEVSA